MNKTIISLCNFKSFLMFF